MYIYISQGLKSTATSRFSGETETLNATDKIDLRLHII